MLGPFMFRATTRTHAKSSIVAKRQLVMYEFEMLYTNIWLETFKMFPEGVKVNCLPRPITPPMILLNVLMMVVSVDMEEADALIILTRVMGIPWI